MILCADKGHALARYALQGLPTNVMVANYRMVLPDAEVRQKGLEATRRPLESCAVELPKNLSDNRALQRTAVGFAIRDHEAFAGSVRVAGRRTGLCRSRG